ncbi:N-acetyl-beta-glucosaminyl-glycoprotein 4-beta-N-acetylgalactosaminyltransferase 1 [Cynoglossus semilaevis]|uniref:Beta-1,4-N-acetylgalactosaminyltransferase n=1 Tax=Cynoglossus semilaevis TaxID=244447 RepID=A0A3P8VJ88_CYNSE|nr:N-acetyl-beta-glucosaminyl-glycoprotein 4-beta-N-acetylgalactosaminyltransferase 1 [Cynoglossus semilaevis]XP_024911793.1 N-acetyl-beta-glucosaminyl-glycoprotein 4-beta-N-acetylgalactosaminyltransferase 1 [Cynoglossus semilaevis]
MLRFPVKKIRKQFKLLLLLVLLTSAVWFTYLHINQGKTIKLHFNYGKDGERQTEGTDTGRKRDTRSSAGHHKSEDTSDSREDEAADEEPIPGGRDGRGHARIRLFLSEHHKKLPWKPEYKGLANLHVFEDWCGSSIAQLRKNLHFPLYPHTRTTVKKLAVAPKWKNYGLRIFGFLHPYRDGDFQFSVSSDDNSELWLSPDENPLNARLLVYVGKLGTEWTAPGEFSKFRSQSSNSVHLISSRRYYFELLHKQDDKGSDHVEVGWRPFLPGLKYEVIDSAYISLYTDESALKMNSVDHIPQTLASHIRLPEESPPQGHGEGNGMQHGADMLKPDPRDTFYSTPLIDPSRLENVLPACLYSPTYVVKDFPIARYQGLQFVYFSFVYPNDFTRLTHMEQENKCFYRESPIYLAKFGFYKYMKMDEEEDDRPFFFPNPDDFLEEEEVVEAEDQEEIVGTKSPRRLSHSSQTTHTSNPSHHHSKPGPTRASREGEEEVEPHGEEVDEDEAEGRADNRIIHQRDRRRIFHRHRHENEDLDTDWGRDHTRENIKQDLRKRLDKLQPRLPEPAIDRVLHGRSLSWVHADPVEQGLGRNGRRTEGGGGGEKGVETPPKLNKSSFLLTQKASLSALASRAKQIINNSAHNNSPYYINKKPTVTKKEENKIYITRPRPAKEREKEQHRERKEDRLYRHPREVFPGVFLYQTGKTTRLVNLGARGHTLGMGSKNPVTVPKLWPLTPTKVSKTSPHNSVHKSVRRMVGANQPEKKKRKEEHVDLKTTATSDLSNTEHLLNSLSFHQNHTSVTTPRFNSTVNSLQSPTRVTSYLRLSEITESQQQPDPNPNLTETDQDMTHFIPEPDDELPDYSYEEADTQPGWAEESINWQRTFSVNPIDFEQLRSDWNDLRCNVSGNLQLAESEVVDVLAQYMEKLNERNGGIYTLLRIINIEKRRDSARGNRYLVELELIERGRSVVRLSEYIYLLLHRGRQGDESLENTDSAPASAPGFAPSSATASLNTTHQPPSTKATSRPGATPMSTAFAKPLLCQPVMLQWRRDVMVHFVVPVKNQARWVQQFISDMENLHRQTKDDNFSIIIVDFESEDMDVEQALKDSGVPRYEYLRREGNFERSAGLQMGVDSIEDSHSIVFLCDLHIHFPLNILESIRKHCVEGRLAFAPIVMRLSCGSSPQEPNGYWEVNGFGLFGIYKSDFDKIGGMNTEEYKDRWGGEDWELLDRVLQNGLEVERLRLRNFFHYYHSKRGMWNAQNKKTPKG